MRNGKNTIHLSVERHAASGAWLVTGLLNDGYGDYYHTHRYDGYTRGEAVAMFKEQYREYLLNA
jgi:hypothetical protein